MKVSLVSHSFFFIVLYYYWHSFTLLPYNTPVTGESCADQSSNTTSNGNTG